MYRSLDANSIRKTAESLQKRIDERFPSRGIGLVCAEVVDTARTSKVRAAAITSPNWWLRIGVGFLVFVVLLIVLSVLQGISIETQGIFGMTEFLELIDAGINDLLLIGAALFFLVTLEIRFKRHRALQALHELRSLAHVIDMHQLVKDPERMLVNWSATPSSPVERMTSFELIRYLDYCSEMLSIIGKVAALYVQDFDDEVALASVNEIEDLTTGFSRKIWQKIMIIRGQFDEGSAYGPRTKIPFE